MIIETLEKNENYLEDALEALLNLSNEQFTEAIETIYTRESYEDWHTYLEDKGLEFHHAGNDSIKVSLAKYLEYFANRTKDFPTDSPEYGRIQRLLSSRDIEKFAYRYRSATKNWALPNNWVVKGFRVLSDNNAFEKFINWEENKDYFEGIQQEYYMNILEALLGKVGDNGEFEQENELLQDFYIPNIEKCKERFLELYNILDMKNNYKFDSFKAQISEQDIIRTTSEPEWNISPKLHEEVYKGMPENLTLEEKAVYIYYRLCEILQYDEGFNYRTHKSQINYTSAFSKKHLESIEPNTKITCFDFARIYAKMINDMDDHIEGVIIRDSGGHFSCRICYCKVFSKNGSSKYIKSRRYRIRGK